MNYINHNGYRKPVIEDAQIRHNNGMHDDRPTYSIKEFFSKISLKLVIDTVITVAIVLTLAVLFAVAVPIRFYAILTDSMEPKIGVHSLVFINTRYKIDELKEGDIIAFRVDFNNDGQKEIVVHYFHSTQTDGQGNTVYRTIAENKTQPDPWTVSEEDIIGVYVDHIPKIGLFVRFFTSPMGIVVLIVDVIIIIWIVDLFKHKKKMDKEYADRRKSM